jgi:hypothetical protein
MCWKQFAPRSSWRRGERPNPLPATDARKRRVGGGVVRRQREVYVLIEIREEHPRDLAAIRDVNKRAFGQDQGSTRQGVYDVGFG